MNDLRLKMALDYFRENSFGGAVVLNTSIAVNVSFDPVIRTPE